MRLALRAIRVATAVLCILTVIWIILPWGASAFLEWWFVQQGYQQVTVRLGYPGLRSIEIPVIQLTRRLGDEDLSISLSDSWLQYRLSGLIAGRFELIILPAVSIDFKAVEPSPSSLQSDRGVASVRGTRGPLSFPTISDLVRWVPVIPCEEVRIGQLRLFREGATGPLQTIMMFGSIAQREGELVGDLSFRGSQTILYELQINGRSASNMTFQLRTAESQASPIVLWRSESKERGPQVELKGVVDVNIQELAPFLALALPVGTEWQDISGTLSINWSGTAAAGTPITQLWSHAGTELYSSVQMDLKLPDHKGLVKNINFGISGLVEVSAGLLHWTIAPGDLFSGTVNLGRFFSVSDWRRSFVVAAEPVSMKAVQEITGEVFLSDTPPRFTAAGPLAISYGSQESARRVDVVATQLSGLGKTIDRFEGRFHLQGIVPRPINESMNVKQMAGILDGIITLNGLDVSGAALTSSVVTFTGLRQGLFDSPSGKVQLLESLPFHLDLETGQWGVGPGSFAVRPKRVMLDDHPLTLQQARVELGRFEGRSGSWKGEAVVGLKGLSLMLTRGQTIPVHATVRLTADSRMVNADVSVKSQVEELSLAVQLAHAVGTGKGNLKGVFGPVTFDRSVFRLQQVVSPWPYPIDVTDGRVMATFEASWGKNAQQQTRLKAESADLIVEMLDGHYRNILLTGLSTKMHITASGLEKIEVARPAEITIDKVNVGVEMTNIEVKAQGEWELNKSLPVAELRDLRCTVFGGMVTSQGARADMAHPPFSMTLLANHLDLEEILKLEQQEGLGGSGLIDGSIPVTVTDRGLLVNDARFEARPPGGMIRYRASPEAAKTVTQANASMQIVLQALNNFHYNVLQVGAQYGTDGMLNLRARLEGRNPDLKKSPPVHFNLTVQENVPALLKSLRLVQDIEESVEKKLVRP